MTYSGSFNSAAFVLVCNIFIDNLNPRADGYIPGYLDIEQENLYSRLTASKFFTMK